MAKPLKSRRRIVVEWLLTIGVAIVGVLAFEAEVAKPYRIPSASMEPTLHCARPADGCRAGFNDRVLVDRLTYRFRAPRRGEVVVFEAPAQADRRCSNAGAYIKRLIGLPGEVVSERRGQVLVDGRPLREPYLDPRSRDTFTRTWPRVPPGNYFFMGDNRRDSCDSRVWGTVPRSAIVGRVVATYWPPARLRFW
jgi:signal peptidase I